MSDNCDDIKEDIAECLSDSFSIGIEMWRFIRRIIPSGETILEIGSGMGTVALCENYQVYTVENQKEWLGKATAEYIHAPLVGGWYDRVILDAELPRDYALLLVDGPAGEWNRAGILDHLDLFDTSKWILFDDIHREGEKVVYEKLCAIINREHKEINADIKYFGVIVPEAPIDPKVFEEFRILR